MSAACAADTPSPAVVAAGLVATGALAAVVTRPLVRLVRKREAPLPSRSWPDHTQTHSPHR